MRILFTRFPLESASGGGAENQTMWLSEGLRDRGHTVSFLGSCPVLLQIFSASTFQTQKLTIGPPPVTKWHATSFLWRRRSMQQALMHALDALSPTPDAICMLSLSEKVLLTDYAQSKGIKVFWIEHDRIGPWLQMNPWLPALKKASAHASIVCVSELSQQLYIEMGFDPKRVVAIPNGVPAETKSEGKEPRISSLPPGEGLGVRVREKRGERSAYPHPPAAELMEREEKHDRRGMHTEDPHPPTPSPKGRRGEWREKTGMNPYILRFARFMRGRSTSAERVLWSELRHRKMCGMKFRRQHPVLHRILDFYCHEARLGIEVDGASHNRKEQQQNDQERTKILHEMGIRIIRFSNDEILNNLDHVLSTIASFAPPLPPGEGLGVRVETRRQQEIAAPLRLGCIARLSPEKGIDVLLHALADLPEVSLDIIGTGPDEGYLRTLMQQDAERMGGERISLRKSVASLDDVYASIDALVLPSREHDPFGLVVAEAMMRGVPVLVSDACGIAASLTTGVDALVVRANDERALREAIKSLQDPARRARIARNGTETALRRFTIDRMVNDYEALLGTPSSTALPAESR